MLNRAIKTFFLLSIIGLIIGQPILIFAQTQTTPNQIGVQNEGEADCSLFALFNCLTGAFQWVTLTIGYVIGRIIAFFITLAGSLITILINSNANILTNNYVLEGFKISLSLANLGFVLAIILIAFGTILRVERYEFKRTLSNLVIAALLINFSFAIAGTIIDFTNAT